MRGWPKTKECSPRLTPLELSVSGSILPRLHSQCCSKDVTSSKVKPAKVATQSANSAQGGLGRDVNCVKSIRKMHDVECLECDFVARSAQGLCHYMKSVHPQAHPYQCNVCINGLGPLMTIVSMRTPYIHKKSWLVTCAILALIISFG